MIKSVYKKMPIMDYKKNPENDGRIAIYDIKASAIVYEGDEEDWAEMEDWVEAQNVNEELYHLTIVPHFEPRVRGFYWR